jgi:hypothetical protein
MLKSKFELYLSNAIRYALRGMPLPDQLTDGPGSPACKARGTLPHLAKEQPLAGTFAVFLGALFMAWPAIYNGYPLIYPDTLDYIMAGRPTAAALLLHHMSHYYGVRSLIYSLGILPFHWDITVWPVIAVQCLLTSFVLWLVFRSIVPDRPVPHFLGLILLLSLFSSMSWYGSFAMPDILGPVLYLSVYLLVFARETLSRVELLALYLISWWAVASHTSHLLVVVALYLLLALLAIFRREPMREHLRVACALTATVALAVGAQIALNGLLYGKPSFTGNRPPFLTARLVADGPGRWYLQQHCKEQRWEMCNYVHSLSDNADQFLWDPHGVWASASLDSQKRILREDTSLARAVLGAYPREQFEQSAKNFWMQLSSFRLQDLGRHTWIVDHIGAALPRAQKRYLESRQPNDQIPQRFFSSVQYGGVILAIAGIVLLIPWLWRCRPRRLLGLGFVVASAVVSNALVTGTLSGVENRYQCRVIWLLPLLAALCAVSWKASRSVRVEPRSEF